MTSALEELAELHGVATHYIGQQGETREATRETLRAILMAMDVDAATDAAAEAALAEERDQRAERRLPHYVVAEAGMSAGDLAGSAAWRIDVDRGEAQEGSGPIPPLPIGRHTLTVGDEICWILSAPAALDVPATGWGVTVPLYGLRSEARGGLGDYTDLAQAAEAAAGAGASFIGLNPVHAGFGFDPGHVSPYSPSHRRMFATQHIGVAGEDASGGTHVDYGAALPLRLRALRKAFDKYQDNGAFDAWVLDRGATLQRYATYAALAEVLGPTWDTWDASYHDPDGRAVQTFAKAHPDRLRFQCWLQFMAELQLAQAHSRAREAGMRHGLYLDLAVGTHPDGAETWAERESFAFGVSLGAPPDAFSADGQRWGLAPFNPRHLVESGFAALAATLRAQMRVAGMLRIDHILGFERAFWVPDGHAGTYVRMPKDGMLAIVRMEAALAGVTVVGEDLGNIPDGLHDDLSNSHVLGCEVAQFQTDRAPGAYRSVALASFGTHDLPTWRGWREGHDIDTRLALGSIEPDAAQQEMDRRRWDVGRLMAEIDGAVGSPEGAREVDRMHAFLGRTASSLVALQIEDILDVDAQANLPGTTDEYPNWRRRLPVDARDLARDERVVRTGEIMRTVGR